MKRKYCCDASRRIYSDHYAQSGSGLPYFTGYRGQRGHGLGSFLSGLFRSALPILRRGLGFFGREALRTGAKIATDVSEGQSIADSAKRRVTERINEFIPNAFPQSGSGRRSGQKRKRATSSNTNSRKRRRCVSKRKKPAARKRTTRRRKSSVPTAFL
jgi:hypothetical protein